MGSVQPLSGRGVSVMEDLPARDKPSDQTRPDALDASGLANINPTRLPASTLLYSIHSQHVYQGMTSPTSTSLVLMFLGNVRSHVTTTASVEE